MCQSHHCMDGPYLTFHPEISFATSTRAFRLIHMVCEEIQVMGGGAKNPEFIYKKIVFIVTCLNFSHLLSTFPFYTIHLSRCFFHGSEQFLK